MERKTSGRNQEEAIEMNLYLTRHGETDWNLASRIQGKTDIPLNERGRQQAAELSCALKEKEIRFDKIYTSRLLRAKETAEIVAESLQLPLSELDGIEEMDLGEWEGYTWKQVKESFDEEYRIWHDNRRYRKTPGGESYEELLERILPALGKVAEEEGGNALIVTHSAVIMTLLSYLHEKPFEDMAKNFKTKNAELVVLTKEHLETIKGEAYVYSSSSR